jgi:hypothetical protein
LGYIGKDGVQQDRVVTDPVLVKQLKGLYDRTKSDGDPIFTYDVGKKRVPIDPAMLRKGTKAKPGYLMHLGSNARPHAIRHYHAAQVFANNATQYVQKKYPPGKKKWDPKDVDKIFMECVLESSRFLGNTPAACLKNYLDPTLIVGFFRNYGIEPDDMPVARRKHLVTTKEIPQGKREMFEFGWAGNDFDFCTFIGAIDLTGQPTVPARMDANPFDWFGGSDE